VAEKIMKGFITKQNIWYRTQQLIILVLHLILLRWMFYVLANSGRMPMTIVFYHFIGMSVMGAFLIRGSAYWARHHYVKELKHELEVEKHEKEL
jgi:apolipoprotein N-acyltransferase